MTLFAGTAHVTAIILCIIRMGLASRSKGVEKYKLSGSARAVHCVAAIAAAANLLLVLFLLNGRIAADTILVVHGKLAPFEWVGESWCYLKLLPTSTTPTSVHSLLKYPCAPFLLAGLHQFASQEQAMSNASHPSAACWCPYADATLSSLALPQPQKPYTKS